MLCADDFGEVAVDHAGTHGLGAKADVRVGTDEEEALAVYAEDLSSVTVMYL